MSTGTTQTQDHPAPEPEDGAPEGTEPEALEADAPEAAPYVQPTFAELGVQPQIVAALDAVGITHPFPIQAMTLPVALIGSDIIGQAKTGTGKTLGFGIPLLQRVFGPGEDGFDTLA